jgi:hypothetical protein
VFLVVEREISAGGESEEGRERERERCLVFNLKQVEDVIWDSFKCASFLIIFSIMLLY